MNGQGWHLLSKALRAENAKFGVEFVKLPEERWPAETLGADKRVRVWRSRDFLVQAFVTEALQMRLSINRTRLAASGRWDDGISWDEMMAIKRAIGYGESWAVELFPADFDVVNVANMRHLWLMQEPPPFAWRRKRARA